MLTLMPHIFLLSRLPPRILEVWKSLATRSCSFCSEQHLSLEEEFLRKRLQSSLRLQEGQSTGDTVEESCLEVVERDGWLLVSFQEGSL